MCRCNLRYKEKRWSMWYVWCMRKNVDYFLISGRQNLRIYKLWTSILTIRNRISVFYVTLVKTCETQSIQSDRLSLQSSEWLSPFFIYHYCRYSKSRFFCFLTTKNAKLICFLFLLRFYSFPTMCLQVNSLFSIYFYKMSKHVQNMCKTFSIYIKILTNLSQHFCIKETFYNLSAKESKEDGYVG